jgi:hypothetical protein
VGYVGGALAQSLSQQTLRPPLPHQVTKAVPLAEYPYPPWTHFLNPDQLGCGRVAGWGEALALAGTVWPTFSHVLGCARRLGPRQAGVSAPRRSGDLGAS